MPERRPPFSGRPDVARRTVLKGGLATLALAPLLQACGGNGSGSAGGGEEKIPSPDNPITWDLSKANPAIESIDAALVPDTKKGYLFFIAKGDGSGSSAFAKTHAEHDQNVAKYGKN